MPSSIMRRMAWPRARSAGVRSASSGCLPAFSSRSMMSCESPISAPSMVTNGILPLGALVIEVGTTLCGVSVIRR